MEPLWLTWAKQLQAIASTGLHFTSDQYDRERYEQVADIAQSMLALLGDVPIEKVQGLITDFAKGYATPRIDVRGAVIENNKILLVQENADQLWSLPGGYADVGLSPKENITKEIREEASIAVEVKALYSIRHKAKHQYTADARDFYKLFFLCEAINEQPPAPGHETENVGFFGLDELPPLSKGRVIEEDIAVAFAATDSPAFSAIVD
jgi:ADP-ribose pyrophosphatase YjhB (NUDIX family)